MRHDVWVSLYREDEAVVEDTLALLDEALARLPHEGGEAAARVREMRNFYAFLFRDLSELVTPYEKWREEQSASPEVRPLGRGEATRSMPEK
ncbi:hypothetical protein SGFS_097480 [Streptomyces graminofaciens]|uniref:Uncharacterized protein n=2 Tax=Streptomyces graminofaciens TaxID=68212 RepID=A0ABN5VYE4_9ACTN|nr:hypothetical protein SGFS_097480 [Streptomyces graminofaciens]